MDRGRWKSQNIKLQQTWDSKESLLHSMTFWAKHKSPAKLRHVLDNHSVAFQMCARIVEGMRQSGYTIRKPHKPNEWGTQPDGKPKRDDVII